METSQIKTIDLKSTDQPSARPGSSAVMMRWHRRCGLFSAFFLLLLITSGLILHHSEQLQLSRYRINSTWLMDLYGLELPGLPITFQDQDQNLHLSQVATRLFFEGRLIIGDYGQLLGLVRLPQILIAATQNQLLLFTPEGEIIEVLQGEHGVPAAMKRIGLFEGLLIVEAAHGGFYQTDHDLVQWQPLSISKVNNAKQTAHWSVVTNTSTVLHAQLRSAYRGHGLSMERILADIHSGNILGAWGSLFVDIISIIVMLILISGVWSWSRRPN